jgi:hypothetical protein
MGVGARPRRRRRCSNLVCSESRWYVTHAILWQKRAIYLHLIGVCIGVNAAIISIVSEWFSDIKMGYCSDGWWLNQQFCCWEMEGDEVDGCETWHTWSTVTLARWIIFIMFAVSFFCRLCSLFRIHFSRLSFRLFLLSLLRILCALLRNMPLVLVYPKLSAFWPDSLCKATWDSQHSSLRALHL